MTTMSDDAAESSKNCTEQPPVKDFESKMRSIWSHSSRKPLIIDEVADHQDERRVALLLRWQNSSETAPTVLQN